MINDILLIRSGNLFELSRLKQADKEFIVNEEIGYVQNNIVVICKHKIKSDNNDDPAYWQCLAASIWS